jgi:hypothetical protein
VLEEEWGEVKVGDHKHWLLCQLIGTLTSVLEEEGERSRLETINTGFYVIRQNTDLCA